jgi:hypothetical protein
MKTLIKLAAAGTVIMGSLGVGQAIAHHSAAMFDDQVTLTMTGTVTKFDYLNPHSWLYVDVVNEDGSTTSWGFETEAPPRLRRVGVGPNHWEAGDIVTIRTHPLRDGRPAGDLAGSIDSEGTTYKDAEGLTAPTEAAFFVDPAAAGDGAAGEEGALAQ